MTELKALKYNPKEKNVSIFEYGNGIELQVTEKSFMLRDRKTNTILIDGSLIRMLRRFDTVNDGRRIKHLLR